MSNPLPEFVRISQAAAFFGVSRSTLYRWRMHDPEFPPSYKMTARTVLYRTREIYEYIERKLVPKSTAQP